MMYDTVVKTFGDVLNSYGIRMPIITVYEHPTDYPTKYVARLFDLQFGTQFVSVADTLDEVRMSIPGNLVRFLPDARDDSHIIEVYI